MEHVKNGVIFNFSDMTNKEILEQVEQRFGLGVLESVVNSMPAETSEEGQLYKFIPKTPSDRWDGEISLKVSAADKETMETVRDLINDDGLSILDTPLIKYGQVFMFEGKMFITCSFIRKDYGYEVSLLEYNGQWQSAGGMAVGELFKIKGCSELQEVEGIERLGENITVKLSPYVPLGPVHPINCRCSFVKQLRNQDQHIDTKNLYLGHHLMQERCELISIKDFDSWNEEDFLEEMQEEVSAHMATEVYDKIIYETACRMWLASPKSIKSRLYRFMCTARFWLFQVGEGY